MLDTIDRLSVRLADFLGVDRCVLVARVRFWLSWHPESRAVRREILRRVESSSAEEVVS